MFCWVLFLSFIALFNSTTGYQLRIVPARKAVLQSSIAANVPFSTPLELELLDGSGDRLTAGPYADMELEITSTPAACLSTDTTATMHSGLARFEGSFCKPVSGVVLTFSVPAAILSVPPSDATPSIEVLPDVYVANFLPDDTGINGKLETFMMGAVVDINDGYHGDPPYKFLLDEPGAGGSYGKRRLHVTTRYTQGTPAGAIKAYKEMKDHSKLNPQEKPVAVIGFGDSQITKVMAPLTAMDDLALLSHTADTLPEFSDKTIYPYFSRLVYSDMMVYNGFMLFLASRKWTHIILINSLQSDVSPAFYEAAKSYNITIVQQFSVTSVDNYDSELAGRFQDLFESVKKVGVNVVVSTVKGATASYMFTEARDANVTAAHGYQWVGFSNEADFPQSNSPLRCHIVPYCNYAFKGMLFNEPLYLVDGFGTLQWQYVWSRHVRVNSLYYPGTGIDLPQELTREGAQYALSYDAVTTYAMAINKILQRFETLTAAKIATEIRALSFRGLSGQIDIGASGDRLNYQGRISSLWPSNTLWMDFFGWMISAGLAEPWDWSMLNEKLTIGYFVMPSLTSTSFTEVKSDGGLEGLIVVSWYGDEQMKTGYIEMDDGYKNLRVFDSVEGLFEMETQTIVQDIYSLAMRTEVVPIPKQRQELVPPPYYCINGCGGNRTDPTDINLYEHGVCVRRDLCSCSQYAPGFFSWSGDSCELPVCNDGCIHGDCVSPGNCVCQPGWSGVDCNSAVCANPTCDPIGGDCIGPNICNCKSGYFGIHCDSKCTCVNGDCNEGPNGNGLCIKCRSPYIGNNCSTSLYTIILPSVLGFLLIVASMYFGTVFFIKRAKLKAALLNTDWIVNWNDVKRFEEIFGRSSMYLSGVSMNKSLAGDKRKQKIANQGTWNGVDIHYQVLDRDSIILTDAIRLEIKQMRDMRHANLISLIGCCIDAPNTAILTEIAPKGSLDDILANEDIQLPWNFRFSLLKDICRGLDYIQHSEIGSHGRLRTTNCLIDNRWTLKLSGFGLQSFRKGLKSVPAFEPGKTIPPADLSGSDFSGLLWTAPEVLRTGVHHIDHVGYGTREGDVYSFAIVITEVCSREHPFHDLMLEKKDIVDLISKRSNPEAMKVWNAHIAKLNMEAGSITRPTLRDEDWPKKFEKRKLLKTLMEKCWAEDPNQRNSISSCLTDLERIDPQRGELMDRLVKMLEKYSSNLEDIVAQRTKELAKEKQRTEDLVARLLPKSVAEELKQGKKSEPENFDCVSIFFSDIVGFTAIAKASTPLQVVAMLNDMYVCFDSITANFDAYKVETIGDAYMVVSGLPIRNGDNHAGEIATIALHLLAAINDFKIAHLPDVHLKLRIGIHSGYVVAGVVGLKMPRYCLFGDTVKVAEKMESGGAALRIHMSDDIAQLLNKLGGYKMEPGEDCEVKGGVVKTWWLTGKDGFNKPLPVPPDE